MPKKQLTIEEKMNNALVPEEEWPYKLPDNWCWVKFSDTCKNVSSSKKKIKLQEYQSVGQFAIVDQGDGLIGGYINNKELVYDGILPVIVFGDHTRRVKFVNFPFVQGADGVKVLLPAECFIPEFYYYGLRNINIPDMGYRRHFPILNEMSFQLPPLSEQQRIVDRIKSLFAKLDEAKEKIQNVLDGAESRKAAILHQAFTGKLTAKWREENGVSDDSWEKKTLDSICVSIYDGDHMAPPKTESGIPFLVISNVNKGKLSFENTRFVSKEYYDSVSDTRKPQLGDVLYTIVGSYGIPVVVDNDRAFCFQRHMALLKPSKVDTYFLWYQLQTKEFYNKATEIATGTAQLTVPIKGLRKLKISLPVQAEQQEIVHRLDNLLNKEKSICKSCEVSLAAIEAMKKAILAKAFRGELGTNNPAEESAKELLTNCLTTVV